MTSRLSVRYCDAPVLTSDMSNATDSELVAASRQGERAAFGELVRRCADMVNAVAYAATRDRALSDDIAQDTFVAAWRDLDRLRDPGALRPWLCRIARNLAHKARRRRAHECAMVDAAHVAIAPTPYDEVRDREVEQVVDAALANVPAPYRETLVLFYFEQQSAKAVAAALGIREDVVHQRLSRGRRHLAAAVERQIETTLNRRRRAGRDLAACVLAAIAVLPSPAHATNVITRRVSMSKLGAAYVAAVTVAVTVTTIAVWPIADAAPRRTAPRASPAAAGKTPDPSPRSTRGSSTHTPSAPPPSPASPASPASPVAPVRGNASCAAVARHIVALSLVALEGSAKAHAAGVQRVTEQLEERCRREPWSTREIACMTAADHSWTIEKCRPAPPQQPVDGPPAPVGADVDISCASVGGHVADLMIESTTLDDLGNVAAAALEDFVELPAGVVESCTADAWSDDLRRCYAASDRFAQTVACNLRWR
jgi:RNA polymerase sigma factor (sigma-70 family)